MNEPLIHIEGFEKPLLGQEGAGAPIHLEGSFGQEINQRLPEIGEALLFPAVGVAFTGIDLILHQFIPSLDGDNTPPNYYRNKILLGIPALVGSRILSDFIGGSDVVRALTIATGTNLLLQLRYAFTQSSRFNFLTFLLHEVILFPLSFLLLGGAPILGGKY